MNRARRKLSPPGLSFCPERTPIQYLARFYRQDYSSFEDYCRQRWQMGKSRAYQLIDAAEIAKNLSTIVETLPTHESQVRPLTKLEPEAQRRSLPARSDAEPTTVAEVTLQA